MIFDLRPFIFAQKTRLLPKSFEEWRELLINQVDNLCKLHERKTGLEVDVWFKEYSNIMYFPKTIVRITRQMCSCDEYCLEYSMYYTKFDEQCSFYDLKNLMTDDLYYTSSFVDKKVLYNRLESKDCVVDEFSLKRNIYNEMVGLCNNEKYDVSELKCFIYELKDHCTSDDVCYSSMLNYNPVLSSIDRRLDRDSCINENFGKNLSTLQSKIKFSPVLRSKREVGSDKVILKDFHPLENPSGIWINYGTTVLSISVACLTIYLLKKKNFRSAILLVCIFLMGLFGINLLI